jgi:ATP-dependent Clp protease ATP-binding subunit ClpC
MPDRFDRFTQRARTVLRLAQEEAQRLHHNYIGTEHLLLGLVREGEGLAAKVLISMGVSLPTIRERVEHIIGRGKQLTTGELRLTPRAKKVFELAVDEAHRLNHSCIGTEHLLLGMIREGEGIAAGVLEDLDIGLQRVRREVLLALNKPFTPANRSAKPAMVVFTALAIVALTAITLRRRIRLLR